LTPAGGLHNGAPNLLVENKSFSQPLRLAEKRLEGTGGRRI